MLMLVLIAIPLWVAFVLGLVGGVVLGILLYHTGHISIKSTEPPAKILTL